MSTTPRTDAECIQIYSEDITGCSDARDYVDASFARQLETELSVMQSEFGKMVLSAAVMGDRNVELRRRAEKAEAELAAERIKVRVLRSTLEQRHTEQGYHRQYVDDVLDATKEASK